MEQKESMPRNESNTNKFYNVALFIDYELSLIHI